MLKAPKFWYQSKISLLALLLLPVSLIWITGTFFKKKFAKSIRSKIPVIAVGSAIIGGSGKTPSVIYVCEILEKMGIPHKVNLVLFQNKSKDNNKNEPVLRIYLGKEHMVQEKEQQVEANTVADNQVDSDLPF